MTHDDVTTALNNEQDEHDLSHDAVGAYILGALPNDEHVAFEAHLRDCPSCQQDLRELGPIAALLPRLYDNLDLPGLDPLPLDLDPSSDVRERIVAEAVTIGPAESVDATELIVDPPTIEAVDTSVEATVPELEDPVVPAMASPAVDAAVAADDGATASPSATVDAAPSEDAVQDATTAPPTPLRRPRGRISPGEAPPESNIVSMPKQRSSILPWAFAAAAVIIAAGSILWALAMMGQVDDLKDERNFQDQQLALLNSEREQYLAQTPANVYPLVATTDGSTGATAMVYMDPDPGGWGGIVAVREMTPPPAGQVYQLWMIENGQAIPGPTFVPDASGQATVQVPGEAAASQAMAITMEPDGGSDTPTTTPIMQGDLTA